MMAPIITLLTDFGIRDTYVASMKGVILGICPKATLVDISHLVPPQDIRAGALLLAGVYRDFPSGTIHLVVVDPGVGTERRALAIRAGGHVLVGPDNGLFSWVLKGETGWEAYSIENAEYWRPAVSRTFHGRDIFAPVAAHLANGVPVHALGPPCSPLIAQWSSSTKCAAYLLGEVIYVDHFGNAITNLTTKEIESLPLKEQWIVRVRESVISTIVTTYGEAEPGTPVALIGSSGHLEISVNQGSAAKILGIRAGDPVSLRGNQRISPSSPDRADRESVPSTE